MRLRSFHAVVLFATTASMLLFRPAVMGQSQTAHPGLRDEDLALAHFVAALTAIDNHAHPVLPPPAQDRDFDALPVDSMETQTDPTAWRADNPQLAAAWHALWNFTGTPPLDSAGIQRLQSARAALRARHTDDYNTWIASKAGIGRVLANRVRSGGLPAKTFVWVPYDDALLFPLNNAGLAAESPDRRLFFPMEDKLRSLYLQQLHLDGMPGTLSQYLDRVVRPILRQQKQSGAVAIKFEVAYLRGFDFGNASEADAAKVYARSIAEPATPDHAPDAAGYKTLQDFLFRTLCIEAGRLGLAVQLHTMSGGGGYFGIAGANPLLLEPLFNDPALRGTRFVLLHGGWPFVHESGALLQKPNVFLDLSQQSILFPPRTLAGWLREWLETFPDKVLFGTDGYPYSESMGWEESTWIAGRNARGALVMALTGMLRDSEIDRPRAESIARAVLRGNAEKLYALPAQ